MSKTNAAFAERTIRFLKIILYLYMEDYGYKYIHKLTQFVGTLNPRRNFGSIWHQKKQRNSTGCQFCTANQFDFLENQTMKL